MSGTVTVADKFGRKARIAPSDYEACHAMKDGWQCSLPRGHRSEKHEAWCTAPDELMCLWPKAPRKQRRP